MLNTGLLIEQSRDLIVDHKPGVNISALLHLHAAHCSRWTAGTQSCRANLCPQDTIYGNLLAEHLWLTSLLVWDRRTWLQCKHCIPYHGHTVHGWQAATLAPCLPPEKCCSFLMRSQIEAVIKSNDHNHLAPSFPVLIISSLWILCPSPNISILHTGSQTPVLTSCQRGLNAHCAPWWLHSCCWNKTAAAAAAALLQGQARKTGCSCSQLSPGGCRLMHSQETCFLFLAPLLSLGKLLWLSVFSPTLYLSFAIRPWFFTSDL